MTHVCHKIVEVRGGQAFAASRNCSGRVVFVDHMGRGWCKRHEPDAETKARWQKLAIGAPDAKLFEKVACDEVLS